MVLAGGGWRPQGDDSGSSRLKLLLALRAQRGHVGWAAFSFEAEVAVRAKAHHEPTVRSPEQWFPPVYNTALPLAFIRRGIQGLQLFRLNVVALSGSAAFSQPFLLL